MYDNEKATVAAVAKKTVQIKIYNNESQRQEQIEQSSCEIPKSYRGIYDRAVKGKSRKAAMHAFCLECCGWQIKEVFLCTDLGCSLYPYRPKPRTSQGALESVPNELESKNSGQ